MFLGFRSLRCLVLLSTSVEGKTAKVNIVESACSINIVFSVSSILSTGVGARNTMKERLGIDKA